MRELSCSVDDTIEASKVEYAHLTVNLDSNVIDFLDGKGIREELVVYKDGSFCRRSRSEDT